MTVTRERRRVIQAKAVWHNGKLVPFAEALIHVSAFGLHYGLGVFEGVRAYRRHDGRTAIFRLDEHITACSSRRPCARWTSRSRPRW